MSLIRNSLVAVTAGGYTAPWKSARVLCPLVIGILLIVVFVLWEWKFAKLPMVPRELFAGQRVVGMSFLISFIAGIYFYAILNFTPILYLDIYNPDPIKAGGKGVIIILGVFAGAVFPNMLISTFKSRTRRDSSLLCDLCNGIWDGYCDGDSGQPCPNHCSLHTGRIWRWLFGGLCSHDICDRNS